jgi:hypothetical protein
MTLQDRGNAQDRADHSNLNFAWRPNRTLNMDCSAGGELEQIQFLGLAYKYPKLAVSKGAPRRREQYDV